MGTGYGVRASFPISDFCYLLSDLFRKKSVIGKQKSDIRCAGKMRGGPVCGSMLPESESISPQARLIDRDLEEMLTVARPFNDIVEAVLFDQHGH